MKQARMMLVMALFLLSPFLPQLVHGWTESRPDATFLLALYVLAAYLATHRRQMHRPEATHEL